jgi:urate oxidase
MNDLPHPFTLADAAYGKDGIRLLIAAPCPDAPDAVRDCSFRIVVRGRFDASYRSGENAAILPSDTLRRHVLASGADDGDRSLEAVCHAAAERVLAANPEIDTVRVDATERRWRAVGTHSFTTGAPPLLASCECSRDGEPALSGGVEPLDVLITRGSDFTGFRRDALTVQLEARNRPLAGTISAEWMYSGALPAPKASAVIAAALLGALADRPSNAVQQWITEAGAEVLDATPALSSLAVHFASLAITPLPDELASAAAAGLRGHELGGGPIGVTDVRLTRASASRS